MLSEKVLKNLRPKLGWVPEPYDETQCANIFWKPDPSDLVVPRGFISDVVYYSRGTEVPTLYTIWDSIVALSALLKREVWYTWMDTRRLYTNQFVTIVGPPGIPKKSFSIEIASDILLHAEAYIEDPQWRYIKQMLTITDKTTHEALLEDMSIFQRKSPIGLHHRDGTPVIEDGSPVMYERQAEALLMYHELAASMGKQNYDQGFVELLLTLYDRDWYRWRTVKRRKPIYVSGLHTNMLAATTPKGLFESLPSSAKNDGFLSRNMIVYQADTKREFEEPVIVPGAPTMVELRKRAAWICQRMAGGFTLSPKARSYYHDWYSSYKMALREDAVFRDTRSRTDITLLKTATLIRCSRYNDGSNVIGEKDIMDADRLIRRTHYDSAPLMRALVTGDQLGKSSEVAKMQRYILTHEKTTRRDLQTKAHIPVAELNMAIDYLQSVGAIEIRLNGSKLIRSSRKGEERYAWVGKNEDY